MSEIPFIGGTYEARSKRFDAQRTINLYPEASGSGQSKAIASLIGAPGLKRWASVGTGQVRGMLRISDVLAIAVVGRYLYSVGRAGDTTLRGMLQTNTGPVSMASNGNQVMVVDGPCGYFLEINTLTMTQISDPAYTGADRVDFVGGYFVWNDRATQKFQIAGPYSETIDPLDFASAEGSPDNLVSLQANVKDVWLFGDVSTEVWGLVADADFPLQAIQGAFLDVGCAAPHSVAKIGGTLLWLAKDEHGALSIHQSQGYASKPISPPGIEKYLGEMSDVSDAVGYTYQQEGHAFYMLSFPTGDRTLCYDLSTSLWHERAYRDPDTAALGRHRSNCHMAFAGKHLVGDWEVGHIYELDLDTYTDDGDTMPAIRQFPHVASGGKWQFFDRLWIDMETGVGEETDSISAGSGGVFGSIFGSVFGGIFGRRTAGAQTVTQPNMMLEWSDDGGWTFPNRVLVPIGRIGERMARAVARRLGKSRDRVWRVTITDPVKRVFIGADADVRVGAS